MGGATCTQPGCGGTIDGGFCNRCGLEPPNAGSAVTGTGTSGLMAGTGSATIGSSRSATLSSSSRLARVERHSGGSTQSSSRLHIGLGLVAVPELPQLAPESVIIANPQVPPNKRFCGNPACHDAQGNPTPLTPREVGFCPACGKPYSFVPSLKPNDVVADQYEVKGCLAYGGLGWVYLATDTMLNRWVVLKGLLNATDESAAAAAVAERQFLAAVKHPNIVGIYNFVTRGTEGFIVMEYVNGTSVKTLRKEAWSTAARRSHRLRTSHPRRLRLPARRRHGVLRHEARQLHARRRAAGRQTDRHGGRAPAGRSRWRHLRHARLQCPEAGEGPTVASDLYTIGRTLAVLLMEFRFQSVYEFDLPPPVEQEVLAHHDSLYRFLLKATQRNPNLRFQSADEMADQLAGVLRDVVAGTRPPQPVESTHFQGDAAGHERGTRLSQPQVASRSEGAGRRPRGGLLAVDRRRVRPAPTGRDVEPGYPAVARFQGIAAPPGAQHD